jgi:hypothetical protein
MSHSPVALRYKREAKMLCKKIVNFFSLLSHTQDTKGGQTGVTGELLSSVTGLAHYLKVLIRVALTSALRLVCVIFYSDQVLVFSAQVLNRFVCSINLGRSMEL